MSRRSTTLFDRQLTCLTGGVWPELALSPVTSPLARDPSMPSTPAPPPPPPPAWLGTADGLGAAAAGFETKGQRSVMEDALLIQQCEITKCTLLAVFDGHRCGAACCAAAPGCPPHARCAPAWPACCRVEALGPGLGSQGAELVCLCAGCRGMEAAFYLRSHMQQHMEARWTASASAEALLAGALLDANADFNAEWTARRVPPPPPLLRRRGCLGAHALAPDAALPHYPRHRCCSTEQADGAKADRNPGSTALVALVYPAAAGGWRMAVAHVGDSRAVMCQDGKVRSGCRRMRAGCGPRQQQRQQRLSWWCTHGGSCHPGPLSGPLSACMSLPPQAVPLTVDHNGKRLDERSRVHKVRQQGQGPGSGGGRAGQRGTPGAGNDPGAVQCLQAGAAVRYLAGAWRFGKPALALTR